jgi:hypothetical protein
VRCITKRTEEKYSFLSIIPFWNLKLLDSKAASDVLTSHPVFLANPIKRSLHFTEHVTGCIHGVIYIIPANDAVLFVRAGDFGINVVNGEAVRGRIPLDSVVNPLLKRDVRISLAGLPPGLSLIRPYGGEIPFADGCAVLTKEDPAAFIWN